MLAGTTVSEPQRRPLVMGTGLVAFDHIISKDATAVSSLGGSCGNVVTSLGMLRHRVAPLIRIGFDQVGDYLVDELRAAHCELDFVTREHDLRSPVIFEHIDPLRAVHHFDFLDSPSPTSRSRWVSITASDVQAALSAVFDADVFYADRVSPAIVDAMEEARRSGAIVYFEPSSRRDNALFARAVAAATILKVSADRLSLRDLPDTSFATIFTRGKQGMTLRVGDESWDCPPAPVYRIVDTCGAGDMVTVGVLHRLLLDDGRVSTDTLRDGVVLGSKLAALNCAFVGARGLFLALGEDLINDGVRRGLDELFVQRALIFDAYAGYRPHTTQRLHA